ncbi:Uu.00g069160.m01.CDS01 [Anthostomella pinea]|uniref:Uu.00g069160.m01.CDS01 n=1 Tax=Anthostomella pinea TaxID=933095 RepID=A0AAI8VNV5_9PEZI|nr:Uu.00g069160.m01.CDS01 [Anthostomella pinea]
MASKNSPGSMLSVTSAQQMFHAVPYHAYSIWLFTFSDLKTIVFPETLFGLLTALSQTAAGPTATGSAAGITKLDIIQRSPLVLLWVWINLLPFAINNQRRPEAIAEDAINKPWRTMPTGRWSQTQAKNIMAFLYVVAVVFSWRMGGLRSSLALIGLGFWYNDGGGADVHALVRNLINALGFTSFGTGALEMALNRRMRFEPAALMDMGTPSLEKWLIVVAAIVFTTVHTQDMYDQEGDAQRGRLTVPLQMGETTARWAIGVFMPCWGLFCPYFWQCGWLGYALTTPLAAAVAYRSLAFRTVEEDKTTFRIWNAWMVGLYVLPLIQALSR